jgi:hypothetical protein
MESPLQVEGVAPRCQIWALRYDQAGDGHSVRNIHEFIRGSDHSVMTTRIHYSHGSGRSVMTTWCTHGSGCSVMTTWCTHGSGRSVTTTWCTHVSGRSVMTTWWAHGSGRSVMTTRVVLKASLPII